MPAVNNWDSLTKKIIAQANAVLEQEIFEEVRDVMQKHIDSDVYDVYEPVVYIRRDTNGGIISDENITKEMLDSNVLAVSNVTPFNGENNSGKTLVEVIESGDGYMFHNGGDYEKPRPFIQNTITDLAQNKQHIAALKHGLNSKGIKT